MATARKSSIRDNSMFGKNFKYVLILTILAWMVYTLPAIRATLAR